MKILVFVKQVPDTDNVKLDSKTGNLIREGVKSVLNPYDSYAIETALRLREKNGGSVVAVTMGPPQAISVLKTALAMGCDDACLISGRALGGADTLATGYPLAKAAEKIGDYDLLIFGRCSTDAETAQVGPIVAEHLRLPQVTMVTNAEYSEGWLYCDRVLEDRSEKVGVKLPAVLCIKDGSFQPRYPHPVNIMALPSKTITVWNENDINCEADKIGIKGSPSSTKKLFEPQKHKSDISFFRGSIDEMAKQFVDVLEKEHLL